MNKEQIKGLVGNIVRAALVLILLIFLGTFLASRYGL